MKFQKISINYHLEGKVEELVETLKQIGLTVDYPIYSDEGPSYQYKSGSPRFRARAGGPTLALLVDYVGFHIIEREGRAWTDTDRLMRERIREIVQNNVLTI